MLSPWTERPQEISHLLNPAFLGALIHRAISGFRETSGVGMPLEYVALVLPLVLHQGTRDKLPGATSTIFASWVQEHREVLVDFAPRAEALLPYARESLMFLISTGMVEVDSTGRFNTTDKAMKGKSTYHKISDDVHAFWLRSHFVGRWLASAGTSSTIYAILGIRP